MIHVVLLGDSVFDNAPYVEEGREVVEALRRRLDPERRATLLARDGAVLADAQRQVERLTPRLPAHRLVAEEILRSRRHHRREVRVLLLRRPGDADG